MPIAQAKGSVNVSPTVSFFGFGCDWYSEIVVFSGSSCGFEKALRKILCIFRVGFVLQFVVDKRKLVTVDVFK